MDEFLRVLEADVKTSSGLKEERKQELIELNKSLLLRIEKVEQEKKDQLMYLAEIMQLMDDLKEAYTLSNKKNAR